jgi:hypothetical protein
MIGNAVERMGDAALSEVGEKRNNVVCATNVSEINDDNKIGLILAIYSHSSLQISVNRCRR